MNDRFAHPVSYFFVTGISVFVVCAIGSLIGYAIDHNGPFRESNGAGIGLIVGFVLWIAIAAWFIANGAFTGIRVRRRERRRLARIEARRRARDS